MPRNSETLKKRREMNAAVWIRDGGRCIICGSKEIIGATLRSGAHHILGRNRLMSEDEEYCCLLCAKCHNDDANTTIGRGHCLLILQERHGYRYPESIEYYIDEWKVSQTKSTTT